MILTPEEQKEYREEIDYLIETRGYEYVWGTETAVDKTKGLLRDVPTTLVSGINKIITNPNVIEINEKLKAHSAKLNAEDDFGGDTINSNQTHRQKRRESQPRNSKSRRNESLGHGFDFGNDHL